MIVVARVSSHFAFHFADPEKLFADGLKMFDDDRFGLLGVLQSRLHEVWANATSSRFGKSLRYSTSTSFDTFPLRAKAVGALAVADAAEEYLRKRQQLLWQFNVGTTDLYGKFHDPSDDTAGIVQLRKAHAALDEAVVHAYGWDGFPTACEFVGDSGTVTSSDTLQDRVRYRWPDSVRDEALERLLELNDQRAKDDLRSGRVVTTQVERSNSERSIKATQTEALFQ